MTATPVPSNRRRSSMLESIGSSSRRLSLKIEEMSSELMTAVHKAMTASTKVSTDGAEDGKTIVDHILDKLSDKDKETAARASFEYRQEGESQDDQNRDVYAEKLVQRIAGAKSDKARVLETVKSTLKFRREIDMDNLLDTFNTNSDAIETEPTNVNNLYKNKLTKQLQMKAAYVQGYDKEGRSTYIFIPRNVSSHDSEWTLKMHIYTLERAIACSKSKDKTVNAVVDFNGFSLRKHAPPTPLGKQFMITFRNYYAGSVNQIYLLDAPTTFFCLWTILKPFVAAKTKRRIHFISSSHHDNNKLQELYNNDQAADWMTPSGQITRELDLDEYLYKIPFNKAFNETTTKELN